MVILCVRSHIQLGMCRVIESVLMDKAMTNTDAGQIHQTDVAIIGAGPVGLFAVFECGMLKMQTHVIDALDAVGGQCKALYPEKPIYDIPGFPQIDGAALIDNLEEQAAPFSPVYHLGQTVDALTPL